MKKLLTLMLIAGFALTTVFGQGAKEETVSK
jgi:hypothetical protein